jgi:hypothetical protein
MFQNLNKIGRPMMCEDPFDLDYSEIIKAIEDNMKLSHCLLNSGILHLTPLYAGYNCK